ncbi:Uncharacterised protein [Cedecea neteri]|uniref:Uncharacterized protein n=1 Tax=Cedecea neteri TaxID=158822 RepID=A0A2X3J8I7_9ENTR|nr:Uncharacterised protein [Cedecea neteri]
MLAAAAFGLGTARALFPCSFDRFSRVGAHAQIHHDAAGAALLLCAASPSVEMFIAAQLIAGIASGIALPAIYASAAAIAEPDVKAEPS